MTRLNQIETENKACAVRDYLSVEKKMLNTTPCAVRYNIYLTTYSSLNHIAYQPAVGHSLRHAGFRATPFFYQYVVPTGQEPSMKSLNPCKSVIPC